MNLKPLVLIIAVVLDCVQDAIGYKIPQNTKLDNGDVLSAILKNPPLNRIELKAKCNACKLQNKCKLQQEPCAPCEDLCEKYYQQTRKKPEAIVGVAQKVAEIPEENEDRYYTVGAVREGPVQRLLQRLLNLKIKGEADRMIVMVKPKSGSKGPTHVPVIIDTAHVFAANEGDAKKFDVEVHQVGTGAADGEIERLVEELDNKFEDVVEEKKKAHQDAHLMPEEIDRIINETINKNNKQPVILSARLPSFEDDKTPNTDFTSEQIQEEKQEVVGGSMIVQPESTYEKNPKPKPQMRSENQENPQELLPIQPISTMETEGKLSELNSNENVEGDDLLGKATVEEMGNKSLIPDQTDIKQISADDETVNTQQQEVLNSDSLLLKPINGLTQQKPVSPVVDSSKQILGNIEESASKMVGTVAQTAQENNEKIKELVQQIFPDSSRNLDEIKLTNNQKFISNLAPDEQTALAQTMEEPTVGGMYLSPYKYKKHPRLETNYHRGKFVVAKKPPVKHFDVVGMENPNKNVDEEIPFIDRNLLDMDSVLRNTQKNNLKDNHEESEMTTPLLDVITTENPKVGCKKDEEDKYMEIIPPTKYDSSYRSASHEPHIPTLEEILHPKHKLHHSHHHQKPFRTSSDDISSEELVGGKHHRKSFHDHFHHMGKFVPREHSIEKRDVVSEEDVKHKSMFFVGDGIKLPLTLKEFKDGSLHLSIDVNELCNCKHCNGKRRHNASEIAVKVLDGDEKPRNAIPIVSEIHKDEEDASGVKTESEDRPMVKRAIWDNRIEKVKAGDISPEKFTFLKDIFSFMKNLVSEDIDFK